MTGPGRAPEQPPRHTQRHEQDGAGPESLPGTPAPAPNPPFWVSFVEQTSVEIWKESLLMVQLPRLCMLLPVTEWPFSSSSAFVEGRLKYVAASSSFLASACGADHAPSATLGFAPSPRYP